MIERDYEGESRNLIGLNILYKLFHFVPNHVVNATGHQLDPVVVDRPGKSY